MSLSYDLLKPDFTLLHTERIGKLETKLRSNEDELRRKEKIILELEAQLEAAKNSDKGQSQIEEISIHFGGYLNFTNSN